MSQPDTAGEILNFSFSTFAGPGDEVRLSRIPTIADIGQTFAADPALLARFNDVLTTSAGARSIDSGFGIAIPRHAGVSEFFDGPFMGEFPPTHSPDNDTFIMKAFVPQLGLNFSGYRITRLDQTIDGMSIQQTNPTTFSYWGAHTIRIFGERIPEPAAVFLVAQAVVGFAWKSLLARRAPI
jgi:hypothetical protein